MVTGWSETHLPKHDWLAFFLASAGQYANAHSILLLGVKVYRPASLIIHHYPRVHNNRSIIKWASVGTNWQTISRRKTVGQDERTDGVKPPSLASPKMMRINLKLILVALCVVVVFTLMVYNPCNEGFQPRWDRRNANGEPYNWFDWISTHAMFDNNTNYINMNVTYN